MAAYPDPPPVILLPEYYIAAHIAAQAAYQLRYKNPQYYSWVGSPKCFQVLGISPSLHLERRPSSLGLDHGWCVYSKLGNLAAVRPLLLQKPNGKFAH